MGRAETSGGGFAVVWAGSEQGASERDIFGQLYSAEGTTVGTEFRLNSITTGRQDSPVIDSADDGSFVVAWTGADSHLYARRFDAMGAPLGIEFPVNTQFTNSPSYPEIAVAPDGSFFMVWQHNYPNIYFDDVYARHFGPMDTPSYDPFRINANTIGAQVNPSVAVASGGNYLVAWDDGSIGPNRFQITAQLIGSNGLPIGENFRADTGYFNRSAVTSVDDGFLVTVVGRPRGSGDPARGRGVHGRRFNASAVPLGDEFRIDPTPGAVGSHGPVDTVPHAVGASGRYVVVWNDPNDDDGSNGATGVFAQTFRTDPPPCSPSPLAGCRQADARKSRLLILDDVDDKRDRIKWTWKAGDPTPTGSFKTPGSCRAQTSLCVYDGQSSQSIIASAARAGLLCGNKPCWKSNSSRSTSRYRDRDGFPNGIASIKLRATDQRRSPIKVDGRGANLAVESLGLSLPVTVQLVVDDGGPIECWEASYSQAARNDLRDFRAIGP